MPRRRKRSRGGKAGLSPDRHRTGLRKRTRRRRGRAHLRRRREELFVASKVAAELKTYEDAAKSIDETLERIGLGYLDQMIIHSPQPWSEFRVEKRYFEENKESGVRWRMRGRRARSR